MSDWDQAKTATSLAQAEGAKRWQKIMALPGYTLFKDISTGREYRREQFIPVPHREKEGECEVFKIFDEIDEVCVAFLRLKTDLEKGHYRCSLNFKPKA